jgi:hypothetical protein
VFDAGVGWAIPASIGTPPFSQNNVARVAQQLVGSLAPVPILYAHVSKVEATMSSTRLPLPQARSNKLTLQMLSLGPAHGYAIAHACG